MRSGFVNWGLSFVCVQYHPDVNKDEGAEEKFKEIANAYEVCGFFSLCGFCVVWFGV